MLMRSTSAPTFPSVQLHPDSGGLPIEVTLIARLERGVSVVIGVPTRNLEAWRKFAGGMSVELSSDSSEVADWLKRTFPLR